MNGRETILFPALTTIKGIDANKIIINLDLFERPPLFQPNISSIKPIRERRETVKIIERIGIT